MHPSLENRRVHARGSDGTEIVRYERAGKWYRESPDERVALSVYQAAWTTVNLLPDAQIVSGLPGGSTFERWVMRLTRHHGKDVVPA